jgi:hypothetical protein
MSTQTGMTLAIFASSLNSSLFGYRFRNMVSPWIRGLNAKIDGNKIKKGADVARAPLFINKKTVAGARGIP